MPKNNNPYYISSEIKKPVEIVQELKGDEYQIPTLEEFMKTYKSDSKVEKYLYSTSEALQWAHRLEDGYYSNVSSEVEKKCAVLIREAVRYKDRVDHNINGYVKVKGKFWGGYEWSYKF